MNVLRFCILAFTAAAFASLGSQTDAAQTALGRWVQRYSTYDGRPSSWDYEEPSNSVTGTQWRAWAKLAPFLVSPGGRILTAALINGSEPRAFTELTFVGADDVGLSVTRKDVFVIDDVRRELVKFSQPLMAVDRDVRLIAMAGQAIVAALPVPTALRFPRSPSQVTKVQLGAYELPLVLDYSDGALRVELQSR